MSRKTVRNLLIFCVVAVVLLSTMIIADFNYVLQNQKPIFCFIRNAYEDGGTVEYIGLGYKITDYNAMHGRQDVDLGSIFKRYDPQIDESKFEIKVDNKNKIYDFLGVVENIQVVDNRTILTVLSGNEKRQNIKVINSTLIYENNFKAKLTDIVVGSTVEIRTSLVDNTKEIPESIAEIINIKK